MGAADAPGIISSNWEMKPHMAHWFIWSWLIGLCWWWFVLRLNTELQSGGAQLLRQCNQQQSSQNTEYSLHYMNSLWQPKCDIRSDTKFGASFDLKIQGTY